MKDLSLEHINQTAPYQVATNYPMGYDGHILFFRFVQRFPSL